MYKKNKDEIKIGCVIMASGVSRRFGGNKLLAEFHGRSLIQTVLDLTGKDLKDRDCTGNDSTGMEIFTKRIVLTRTWEVEEICKNENIPVIFHELPTRDRVIQLGVEEMQDMDGILFCPCDQPLLKQASLRKMKEQFGEYFEAGEQAVILRLCHGEHAGAPVLFGKENFRELQNIPEGCGGSWLCRKYPERVKLVQTEDELELFDIDTKDDLKFLNER